MFVFYLFYLLYNLNFNLSSTQINTNNVRSPLAGITHQSRLSGPTR